uniref:B30.2/SPRY domain-containing protein n=1 Tax=Meloidogyne hapla TaxID=6305 RepID=A0A1I8C0T0_MELHA
MTEEGSSNSDLDNLIFKEFENIKDAQMKLVNIQNKFIEEKFKKMFELKVKLFEEKNQSLENEMKILKEEIDKKFQKLKSEHENEIKLLKQTLQQLMDEKIKQLKIENGNKFSVLKQLIDQKDEKINSLESQQFIVKISNKWNEIECQNNVLNTNVNTTKGNKRKGFDHLNNDLKMKCIKSINMEGNDKPVFVYAKNRFNKPKEDSSNYSLFYFEIKCRIDGESINCDKNWLNIGLKNSKEEIKLDILEDVYISYRIETKGKRKKLPTFSWNNGDIFGCGLVYPPTKKTENSPYVFFTQNGKQIGNAVLLNNSNYYEPYFNFGCGCLEINFGNDLESKPFIYDILEYLPKEFYFGMIDLLIDKL